MLRKIFLVFEDIYKKKAFLDFAKSFFAPGQNWHDNHD